MSNDKENRVRGLFDTPAIRKLSDELSDSQKWVLTLTLAIIAATLTTPVVLVLTNIILVILTALIGVGLPRGLNQWLLPLAAVFSGWLWLLNGYFKNGELEQSVLGFQGQFTGFTQPTGGSWGIPRSLGGSRLSVTRVGDRELDRTKQSNKMLTKVPTRDRGEAAVGFYVTYRVTDALKARSVLDIDRYFAALMDRAARFFVVHWDMDDNVPTGKDKKPTRKSWAITEKKTTLSEYLAGHTVYDRFNDQIPSDIIQKCADVGIEILEVKGDDIDVPESIVKANIARVAEIAQREAEMADARTFNAQVRAVIEGDDDTKDPLDISHELAARLRAATRGDATMTIIDSNAGDFTTGQVAAADKQKKGGRK